METEYIKTNILDRDLDRFLNPYKADATDLTYGHVLVKRMDKSRPRPADGPKDRAWNHANYPVTTYRADRKDIDGLYILNPTKNAVKPDWMSWLKAIKEKIEADMTLEGFKNVLAVNDFGHQTRDISMKIHGATGLRPDLGVKQNPVASADSIYRVRSNQKDSQAPLVYVNTPGSPLEARTTIGSLTTVAYNHRGSPFQWIIVPPASKDAFEAIIRSVFAQEIAEAACSDFVGHLSLWVMPNTLESWQIKFFEVKQAAGQLLVFFPGSYYWGFSAGHNVIELKQHAGKDWNCDGWNFCTLADSLCHRANRGQPGLFLRPLDGNNQQAGNNEGGQMIDPTPRRTRKRKAVPHESVMEFNAFSPGSGPANLGAPESSKRKATADVVGAGYAAVGQYPYPAEPYQYPAAQYSQPGFDDQGNIDDNNNNPNAATTTSSSSRNIFDTDVFAPGLGGRFSPPSDQEDDYVDNHRPRTHEYATEDPYHHHQGYYYPQTSGAAAEEEVEEVERESVEDPNQVLLLHQQRQIEHLVQQNIDLAQERDVALHECQELRARNEQLASDLRGISSGRETHLREELDNTVQQREFLFTEMLAKDKVIDGLRAELARRG